jgi:hypothetical protein
MKIKILFCFVALAKKTFLGQNKSFWGPLELVEKLVPEAAEITASVKDLPGLKYVSVNFSFSLKNGAHSRYWAHFYNSSDL